MKIFTILIGFMFANLIFGFFALYYNMSEVFPQTSTKVENMLDIFTSSITTQTNSQHTGLLQAIDVMGNLAASMIGIFNVIFNIPEILFYFIEDLFTLFGLTILNNTLYHTFATVVGIITNLYFVYSVIEWIRPGFIRSI